MVSTRRTSLRLQEKVVSAPSSPVADNTTPTRARKTAATSSNGSASKKSPRTGSASKAKTPPKRGGKKAAGAHVESTMEQTQSGDDAATTAAAAPAASSSKPNTHDEVAKELFDDHSADSASEHGSSRTEVSELKSGESTEIDEAVAAPLAAASTVTTKRPVAMSAATVRDATPATAAAASGDDEEEEELLLMDDSDDDAANGELNAADDDDDEDGDDDDEDISAYAMMAASGLNLSTTNPAVSSSSTATGAGTGGATSLLRTKLVPDALDSGASQHATYFAFAGRAAGATLLADKRAQEERATLAASQQVAGLATRQRAEHTNTKSAGRKWFGMASEELTAEARRDFALLRMRNYLDPKKFYKTSDHHKKLPKHFQLGVVVEGAHEFKSARLTKKQRQQTFTDEIMADTTIQTYTKRVFGQIQAARSGQGKKKKARTDHGRR